MKELWRNYEIYLYIEQLINSGAYVPPDVLNDDYFWEKVGRFLEKNK